MLATCLFAALNAARQAYDSGRAIGRGAALPHDGSDRGRSMARPDYQRRGCGNAGRRDSDRPGAGAGRGLAGGRTRLTDNMPLAWDVPSSSLRPRKYSVTSGCASYDAGVTARTGLTTSRDAANEEAGECPRPASFLWSQAAVSPLAALCAAFHVPYWPGRSPAPRPNRRRRGWRAGASRASRPGTRTPKRCPGWRSATAHLHVTDRRQRQQPRLKVAPIARPRSRRSSRLPMLGHHERGGRLHPSGHRGREAVQRRLPEDVSQLGRVHGGDARGVRWPMRRSPARRGR